MSLNALTLNGPSPLAFSILFRAALTTALKSNATLLSILGTRIFPQVIPQTQRQPSLSYAVLSNVRDKNLDGPNGVANARVHYIARSTLASDVDAIREELRNLFDGSTGPVASIQVVNVQSANEEDAYEEPADSSDLGTFEQSFDLIYRYREPRPTLS